MTLHLMLSLVPGKDKKRLGGSHIVNSINSHLFISYKEDNSLWDSFKSKSSALQMIIERL